jgi:hypothetical protein
VGYEIHIHGVMEERYDGEPVGDGANHRGFGCRGYVEESWNLPLKNRGGYVDQ